MGELKCQCGAKAEADTFEEADAIIDHGISRSYSNGCDGDPSKMTWNGQTVATKATLMLVETTKPTKTETTETTANSEPPKTIPSDQKKKKSKGQK